MNKPTTAHDTFADTSDIDVVGAISSLRACCWLARHVIMGGGGAELLASQAALQPMEGATARWREAPAGVVRECLRVFDRVARQTADCVLLDSQAEEALGRLRAVGVDPEARDAAKGAKARGQELGRVLAIMQTGGIDDESLAAVAYAALGSELRAGGLMAALDGAVENTVAGPFATLGGRGWLGAWARMDGEGASRYTPPGPAAWLDAGLDLHVPGALRVMVVSEGGFDSVARAVLMARMAASVAAWSDGDVACFMKRRTEAVLTVAAFNDTRLAGARVGGDEDRRLRQTIETGLAARLLGSVATSSKRRVRRRA